MYFTASEDENEEMIWSKILKNLDSEMAREVCASSSSFYRTADGVECAIRKSNGELIANCYSESDRMGTRRWSFVFANS